MVRGELRQVTKAPRTPCERCEGKVIGKFAKQFGLCEPCLNAVADAVKKLANLQAKLAIAIHEERAETQH